ncbi:hypothetical protein N7493_000787 [Penicillium malachiteum]|uniref:Uncharacterized protein n=1 Tax=Penicillium malachiteum TaxID=1324776 RepID=A0AAD6HX28_9EURO|nr:hypothetical protein N7493_000787 [Penicillium malachiteum]
MRIGLNHFLYKIKAVDLDKYRCGEGSQTLQHVLLQCPKYIKLHEVLFDKLAYKTNIRPTHTHAARYVAEFMIKTGLLGQFRSYEVEPDPGDTEHDTGIPEGAG